MTIDNTRIEVVPDELLIEKAAKSLSWKKRLLEKAKYDPVFFIEKVLGDTLWSKQREISNAILTDSRVASPASFGIGKSFLVARLALWFLFCYYPSKVITTSATGRQVREILWSEIRSAHAKSRVKLGGRVLTTALHLSPDHFAVGFSTDENMDMFTGYHSPNIMVIFDQAGGIPPLVWDAAEGLMTSENSKWLAMSNTAISDCEFANVCIPERKSTHGKWKVISINAKESPNVVAGKNIFPGIIAYNWVTEKEKIWSKDDPLYKIFVEAKFVSTSEMRVLSQKSIDAAFENEGVIENSITVGLDVARSGLDSTVWVARSGTKALEIKRVTGNDTMEVAGKTIEFVRYLQETYSLPVASIHIDIIGLGAGVFDRLNELNMPVVGVNNAEQKIVNDKERYGNVRAEMAWSFRRRMELGQVGLGSLIVEDNNWSLLEFLREDLQVIKYKINSSGKIYICEKDEIKDILGRSPDYWDALVCAFEVPGVGLPAFEFINTLDLHTNDTIGIEQKDWERLWGINVDVEDESFRNY